MIVKDLKIGDIITCFCSISKGCQCENVGFHNHMTLGTKKHIFLLISKLEKKEEKYIILNFFSLKEKIVVIRMPNFFDHTLSGIEFERIN